MFARLQNEQGRQQQATEKKRDQLFDEHDKLQEKLHRVEDGWLDGVIDQSRFRKIKSKLVAKRQSVDAKSPSWNNSAPNG